MRVFLCAFAGFSLAIPMRSVSSIALYGEESPEVARVTLQRLFNLPEENIRHSVFLRGSDEDDSHSTENKVTLLTSEVECEAEIPDEEIFPLPKILEGTRFSMFFSGIQMDSLPRLVLNSEQLVQSIRRNEVAYD